MRERPILFSAPMVRAILAGTKTQARRVVNPRDLAWMDEHQGLREPDNAQRCPYGQPGDRLWVRETFYCDHCFYPYGTPASCYWDGDKTRTAHTNEQLEEERADMLAAMYYRADGEPEFEAQDGPIPWRPSIHMPRWASRITLEITDVRVERLQDISEADAIAEGVDRFPGIRIDDDAAAFNRIGPVDNDSFPIARYAVLWESINGAGSWDRNDWVWVVSFKRVEVRNV